MDKEARNIEVINDEANDYYSDDSLYNITSWGADLSFRELISRYEEDSLIKPEMQRNYVWDKSEASRFIDSILLGLPVPSIFLAKTNDEKMLIVDGYQRIMTVFDYVHGIFSKDQKIFRLTNSEKINERWRGKAFKELSDTEQRKINNTTIHAIIFVELNPQDNDTGMFQVFERINTSGRTLLPQEIRNCIYQGNLNIFLIDINENNIEWRELYGLKNSDSRMRDIEFILRFFALTSETFNKLKPKSQISLKKFLNEFMKKEDSNSTTTIERFKSDFERTISFIFQKLGKDAFHNISKDKSKLVKKFNPTIFDSISIAVYDLIVRGNITDLSSFNITDMKRRRRELLLDDDYQDLIRIRTTNVDRIRSRILKAKKYLFNIHS